MTKKSMLSVFIVVLLSAGCQTTINPPREAFRGYADCTKIPLKVRLRITDELLNKEARCFAGETFVFPIGASIAQNADVLARRTFSEVVSSGATGYDVELTPNLAYLDRTLGAISYGESITTIKVGWTVSDLSGKVIWMDTVSGEGRGSTGWDKPENLLKTALEEMLLKSQRSLSTSQAIKRFAQKK